MNEVTVQKEELLQVLKKNRESHVIIYQDALEGVRVQYKEKLLKEIKKLDDNKAVSGLVNVEIPQSHESQYNEVIDMLEMSVEETVTLSRAEFQRYVKDSWISTSEKNLLRTYALSSSNYANYK